MVTHGWGPLLLSVTSGESTSILHALWLTLVVLERLLALVMLA